MPSYSTELIVRLRGGFHSEETLSQKKGTLLVFSDRAYAIIQLEKNGTSLTAGVDYNFIKPGAIRLLLVAAIETDIYFIVYGTKIPTEMITEAREHATASIDAQLIRRYGIAAINRWKTFKIIHGVVTGGSGAFAVDQIITGQTSGFTGTITSVGSGFILYLPTVDGELIQNGEDILVTASSEQATVSSPSVAETPDLVAKLATIISICYAKEIFWEKNHAVDPDVMDAYVKKKKYAYEMLKYIDMGQIDLPGETPLGGTEKPSIGRGDTGPFTKRLDLEDTDYYRDGTTFRREIPS